MLHQQCLKTTQDLHNSLQAVSSKPNVKLQSSKISHAIGCERADHLQYKMNKNCHCG